MQRQDYIKQLIAHSKHNIFLTGKAGTGKTTLLRQIVQETYKACVVAAPTGIAALNAGGVTLHSLLQLPLGTFIPDSSARLPEQGQQLFVTPATLRRHVHLREQKVRLLQAMELLIIDEVSMLRADTLDMVDTLLRSVRRSPLPFGGVQLLFIGDMLQLPPVVKPQEQERLRLYYESNFFFDAQVLKQYPPIHVQLEKVYRQQDQRFVTLLNHLRYNETTPSERAWLESRVRRSFDPSRTEGYVCLTTHNQRAEEINRHALEELPGAYQDYHAQISGDFPEQLYPVDPMLSLKVGTRVMLIKNDSETPRRYYNGSLATVEEMSGEELLLRLETGEVIEAPVYTWHNERYGLDEETGDMQPEVIGTFKHYPLRLAWAITIHKSQGLTFERAAIDLEAVFSSGQAYVALSRLRSPEGLILISELDRGHQIAVPSRLLAYEGTAASDSQLADCLSSAQRDYWQEQTLAAFRWAGCAQRFRTHAFSYHIESERSAKSSFGDWAAEVSATIEELHQIAERFVLQLQQLWASGEGALEAVALRIEEAAAYFIPRWREVMRSLLEVQRKVRGLRKVKEFQAELDELHGQLIQTLRGLFRIQGIMQALRAGLPLVREQLDIDGRLKRWLEGIYSEFKTPYIVPEGKESSVSKQKGSKQKQASSTSEPKLGTQEQTLELLRSGKSINQIAKARDLAPSTIAGHIAQLMERGLLSEREAGIKPAIYDELAPHFEHMRGEQGFKAIYEATEGSYSYQELRLYHAAFLHRQRVAAAEAKARELAEQRLFE